MEPLLFIHIPKTAGTSLNDSAGDYFGYDAVERDYGGEKNHSSDLVRQFIYDQATMDEYGFFNAFESRGKRWLGGHFFSDRYLHLFGATNTVSFVRDPVERVISEYRDLKRRHGRTEDFSDFYRLPQETNKHFRMIGNSPWRAFHLVGSLERYGECLALLNDSKNISLSEQRNNRGKPDDEMIIDQATRDDIRKWNERDCLFVDEVRAYLDSRLSVALTGKPFCFHDLGFVPDKHIIGWAFYQENHTPVKVSLYIDGRLAKTVAASEHRPELQQVHTPRSGHNGFRFTLDQYGEPDTVEIRTEETQQILLFWQRPTI